MNITTTVQTLTPLADALEFYTIPYHLTGSLATSVYVKTQAVQGIEVVADIKFSQVPALVVQLEKMYDVKEIAMRAAIEHRGSFRLVHHDTLQKIDVALPAYRAYSQVRQERAQRHALEPGSRAFYVASPEDAILTLLERYNGGVQRFQHLCSGRPSRRYLLCDQARLISHTCDYGQPHWVYPSSSSKRWLQQVSPMRSRFSTYFRHVVHMLSTEDFPKK